MRLPLLFLLLLAIVAARSSSSSSRGSSGSRSSSRSSSGSSKSSSSSSRSSSSGLFSGSSSLSKSRTSSSGGSSSGRWSLSSLFKSSKSSSGSSIGAKHSRGKSAAREQSSSGSSIFSSFSRTPKIGSRGSSAARASVISSPSISTSSSNPGTTKQSSFQKIRGKITEAAKKHLPGLAVKASKKLGPKLASYVSRRRTKTGLRVGGGSTTTAVYYPSGGYYQSSSYRLSSGSVPQQTHYETERHDRIHNETRFTEVETKDPSAEEIFIPYNDDLLAQCPDKVDAFLQMENISFVFEDHHMFLIEDGSLNQTVAIYDLFPGGIHKVDASVYDYQFEIILLLSEREVFGFHWNDTENGFKALAGFPKTLPQSITFKPTAAFTWPDGYPILVSEKGEAAAYDAYLNEEVKLANGTSSYILENLPQPLRGISHWDENTAAVFTDHQVYLYDLEQKNVVGEPESLADFFNCFYVDIPSANE